MPASPRREFLTDLMRAYLFLISAVLIFCALILVFVFQDVLFDSDSELRLTPENMTVVSKGEQIYAAQCAKCHGASLEGEPNWRSRGPDGLLPAPPHDASGHTWHHNNAALIGMTKYGPTAYAGIEYESNMPAFEGILSDEEIVAVLSFIKSSWPEHIQEQHGLINQRAKGN